MLSSDSALMFVMFGIFSKYPVPSAVLLYLLFACIFYVRALQCLRVFNSSLLSADLNCILSLLHSGSVLIFYLNLFDFMLYIRAVQKVLF